MTKDWFLPISPINFSNSLFSYIYLTIDTVIQSLLYLPVIYSHTTILAIMPTIWIHILPLYMIIMTLCMYACIPTDTKHMQSLWYIILNNERTNQKCIFSLLLKLNVFLQYF